MSSAADERLQVGESDENVRPSLRPMVSSLGSLPASSLSLRLARAAILEKYQRTSPNSSITLSR